eukprot:10384335-Prorocentrum_lima.AAC.1
MGAECGGRVHGAVGRERSRAGRMGALSCVISLHQVLTSRDCGSCSVSVAVMWTACNRCTAKHPVAMPQFLQAHGTHPTNCSPRPAR